MSVIGRGIAVGASLAVLTLSIHGVANAATPSPANTSAPTATSTPASSAPATQPSTPAVATPAVAAPAPAPRTGSATRGDIRPAGKRLTLKLAKADGTGLSRVRLRNHHTDRGIVVGTKIIAKGQVPTRLVSRAVGRTIALQRAAGTSTGTGHGPFSTIATTTVRPDGTFVKRIAVKKRYLHQAHYRVALTTPKQGRPATNARATTTTTSSTVTATGVQQFTITFSNNTGQDLVVFMPTSQTGTTSGGNPGYNQGKLDVDNGQTVLLTYTNAPANTTVAWYVNQQNCFGKCTNYNINWNGKIAKNSTTCASSPPQFSTGNYNVNLTGQFGAGYDGSIVGPGANCTFQLGSSFQNWFEGHPTLAWIIGALAALVVIGVIVIITVATGGADVAVVAEPLLDATFEEEDDQNVVDGYCRLLPGPAPSCSL